MAPGTVERMRVVKEYEKKMGNRRKILKAVLSGSRNIAFRDLTALLEGYGFALSRINGSHHIFTHRDLPELVNVQNDGGKAKPYQVRQVMRLVEKYNMKLEKDGR